MGKWDTSPEPNLSETEWAYVAGLFDGEGCLYARPGRQAICMSVNMTDEVPKWLHQTIGGTVRYHNPPSFRKLARKPQWHWRLNRKERLLYVLERLLPHLKTKQPQAAAVIEFLRIARQVDPNSPARLSAYQKLLDMNA